MKQMRWTAVGFFLLCVTACSSKGGPQPATTGTGKDSTTPESGVAACVRCMVITDQAAPAIDIVDVGRDGNVVWSWSAAESNVAPGDVKWFTNPDDAKPVYDNRYLLINASGGGVALVRIRDKKAVFYAHVGVNPHSSELLPDGNIVTASSTDNRLVIFHVDTLQAPNSGYRKVIPMPFAHNVVWDRSRQVLWSAGKGMLYKLGYNGDCAHPDLSLLDSVALPGTDAHELFPVYGKDSMFLTNPSGAYYLDMKTLKLSPIASYDPKNIKSLSAGPSGWPVLVMTPRVSWWSDEVRDLKGDVVYVKEGLKIYKARWLLENLFSYPAEAGFSQCTP